MTTAFNGYMFVPHIPSDDQATFLSFKTDAASEKFAFIFVVPLTGSLATVHFRTGTVTTGGDVDVRIETVSTTTGDPTGTLVDANATKVVTLAGGDDDKWLTATFATAPTLTRGDTVALVFARSTGDYDFVALDMQYERSFPYSDHFTGTWSKKRESPVFGFEYTDSTRPPIPGVYPYDSLSTLSIASNTTPDELGIRFKFPFPIRAGGCWYTDILLKRPGEIRLYDSDGTTVLAKYVFDFDQAETVGPQNGNIYLFDSTAELLANTFYRIAVRPTSTLPVSIGITGVDATAFWNHFDGGPDWTRTERTDDGAWTETVLERVRIGLLLDGFASHGEVGITTIGRLGGGMI